jgi:hypothetical protein
LIVEIIEPPLPPDATTDPAPNILHFETPLFSTEIPVADLAGLEVTHPAGPEGNAVKFSGWRVQTPGVCPKGFLGGLWRADSDSSGHFKGCWVTLHGRLFGLMRGAYGYNDAGERVLVGKYISRQGRFRGLLRGTWAPDPAGGHGSFNGHWVNAAGTRNGIFGGQFAALPERPGGFFGGRWTELCDDEGVAQLR